MRAEDCCAMAGETKRWFNVKYLSPSGLLRLVRERQMYQRDRSRKKTQLRQLSSSDVRERERRRKEAPPPNTSHHLASDFDIS